MNLFYEASLFIFSALLLSAPLWAHFFQTIGGHALFLQADSLVLLGLTFFVGLLSKRLLPNQLPGWVNSLFRFVRSRFAIVSVVFLLSLLLGLYAINQHILHACMNSGDEHSCYFLAECIRSGKWWATPHPLPEFFDVVHVGNKGGKWFSVYPPGWPLLFALGLQLKIANWTNPLLTIASIPFLFKVGEKIFGFSAACFGIFFTSLTPFFLFNGASYFSHSTALLTIAIFLYAYLKWREKRSSFWAGLSAFALGYGLGTRYLTTAALGMPFLVYELIQVIFKRKQFGKDHLVFGFILTVMLFLNLYYNYLITGNFFDAPNHYYHRWERLGFHGNYTFLDALSFVVARFCLLMQWISPVFLVLYLISLLKKGEGNIQQTLFRYAFFYLVVAFMFYYSWGGNQYGPRYYLEGLPFLGLSVGDAVKRWWNNGTIVTKKFLGGLIIASVLGNGYLMAKQGIYFHIATTERKALFVLAEKEIHSPSIVFIHGFLGDKLIMAEEDAVRNHPNLNTTILYAHDLGSQKNEALINFYSNRTYYLGTYDRTAKQAHLEPLKREVLSHVTLR